MAGLASQISQARDQGYSNEEILGHLSSSRSDLIPKIKEAQDGGYGADEILGHLETAYSTGPYSAGASESRKKHYQESAPSWMPFPTAYNAVNSALSEGSHNMYEGLKGIWEGPTMERKAHSASQAVRGLGTAASPALAPALVAAPVPTIIRTLAGLAAQKGIELGAPMVGVPQGYAELGGDITGLAAAKNVPTSLPSMTAPPGGASIPPSIRMAMRLVPGGSDALRMIDVVGSMLPKGAIAAELPGPFKPSPVTKSRMPAFAPGAEDAYSGAAGTRIPRRGFTPPAESVPAPPGAPEPFKPGSSTKRNMPSYSPGAETYEGVVGRSIPRGKFDAVEMPVEEIVPQAPEPFKPGKSTKRNMPKYTPDSEGGGVSFRNRQTKRVNRAMGPEPPPAEGTEMAEASGSEARPALSAENQAAVDRVLSEKAKASDLPGGFPDTPEGVNAAIHQFAKNIWGKGAGRVHEPIKQIIQERYGKNRTMAYKNLEKLPDGSMGEKQPDGTFKIAMEDWEQKDLMRYLLEKSPLRPIEPPPK